MSNNNYIKNYLISENDPPVSVNRHDYGQFGAIGSKYSSQLTRSDQNQSYYPVGQRAQTHSNNINYQNIFQENYFTDKFNENAYSCGLSDCFKQCFPSTVICIQNIPWDVTCKDLIQFFKPFDVSLSHVLMETSIENSARTIGKTLADAYVEFDDPNHAQLSLIHKNENLLKGRKVSLRQTSQSELMRRLFPNLKQDDNNDWQYLTKDERSAVLLVCRNYKLHFSRKCADRPFELIISIISKILWNHEKMKPSAFHRDQIFEMFKISVETLKSHLIKDYYHVSDTIMKRMIMCGLNCVGFTDRQKQVIFQTIKDFIQNQNLCQKFNLAEFTEFDIKLVQTNDQNPPSYLQVALGTTPKSSKFTRSNSQISIQSQQSFSNNFEEMYQKIVEEQKVEIQKLKESNKVLQDRLEVAMSHIDVLEREIHR